STIQSLPKVVQCTRIAPGARMEHCPTKQCWSKLWLQLNGMVIVGQGSIELFKSAINQSPVVIAPGAFRCQNRARGECKDRIFVFGATKRAHSLIEVGPKG